MADNQNVTIIVVPDRKNKGLKLTFSTGHLKLMAFLGGLAVVILAGILVDYIGLLSQGIENKRLHAENSELRAQFKLVESKMNSIETTLERVKTLTTKLKMITAVNDPDRGLNLAMGPQSREELEEFVDAEGDRKPASLMMDEPVFKTKSLPDFAGGILAEEKDRDYAKLSVRLDQVTKRSQMREMSMIELMDFLKDRDNILASTPTGKPVVGGWVTSGFGIRLSPMSGKPHMHEGVDIAANPGTPVYSPAEGIVKFSGYDAGYGKAIIIEHGYGVETRYGHNSQLHVGVGQRVKRGDLIANVGSTGRSTGPHLHYEVHYNGAPVDPTNFIIEQ